MKRIFISLIVLFVLFMIAAIAIPVIYKDKIIEIVKKEINSNLDAVVDFKSLDLSLLRSIPDLSLSLKDLSIVGKGEFSKDTLLSASSLSLKLDIFSVLKGDEIKIKAVDVDKPDINIIVLRDGRANYDIYKEATDEAVDTAAAAGSFNLNLKDYSLKGGNLSYNDMESSFSMSLDNFEHNGSGDFTADNFKLLTGTSAPVVNMWYEGVHYIVDATTNINAEIDVDMKNSKYSFSEGKIKLNELELLAAGFVAMQNDIEMDISLEAIGNEFKNFMSMVPGVYREGFEDVSASGTMAFKGHIKGTYSETKSPGYGINLKLENGSFKYPKLKSDIKNVNVDLLVDNKTGVSDHTVIELKKFHAEIADESIDARLIVKNPETDPEIDGMLKCSLNLAKIKNIIPLDEGTKLNGLVDADLSAKGRLSAIQNEDYKNFDAKGTLLIQAMDYDNPDLAQPLRLSVLSLSFNPRNVAVHDFNANYGLSDYQANGTLDNFLMYALKGEVLKGNFNVFSQKTSLNSMMVESTPVNDDANPEPSVIDVPDNLDLNLNVSIGKIYYDDIILESVLGSVEIKNKDIIIHNLAFNLLEGKIKLSGKYSSKNVREPAMNFDLQVTDMDIKKTNDHFGTVNKLAPLAERCQGKFSAQLKIASMLDQNMSPIEKSMSGSGKLQSKTVSLQGASVLDKIGTTLKMTELRSTVLKDVNLSFKIKDGRLHIEKFNQNISGIQAAIAGSNGFDQTIDYEMDFGIPSGMMSAAAISNAQSLIDKFNSSSGAKLSIGDKVNMKIFVAGTVTDPVVKTGLQQNAGNLKDDLKQQLKTEIDTKKQELEDKARQEADKLKSEAEQKLNAEKEKLQREAEQKKAEAEQKAKEEADRLKKEAEEKAKKEAGGAVKNLLKKPK